MLRAGRFDIEEVVNRGASVLVIDDDSNIKEGLETLLEQEGFQVHAASNGAEAFALLLNGLTPTVIVLDLCMPVMDGQTFLKALGVVPRLGSIPVIIYSAVAQRVVADRVVAYVPKGSDPTALLQAITANCRPRVLH
jgi:CheY-like chemotaxis protein